MQLALQTPAFMSRLFATAPRRRVTRWFAAHVRHGATREIAPPPGRVTVHCRNGEAWITHDGDPKDVVLAPQQVHRPDREGPMRLHAMDAAVVEIEFEDDAD
jgi:hypothetical protein